MISLRRVRVYVFASECICVRILSTRVASARERLTPCVDRLGVGSAIERVGYRHVERVDGNRR